jgi:cobalt transporter subunit CbtB
MLNRRRWDGPEVLMNTLTSSVVVARSSKWPAALALAFGMLVVYGAGFANSSAVHNATHDTRHAFGLPCH